MKRNETRYSHRVRRLEWKAFASLLRALVENGACRRYSGVWDKYLGERGRAGQSAEGDFGTGLFEVGALKAALPDLTGTCAQQRVENDACPTEP